MQVELCRFGGGATPLSGFSGSVTSKAHLFRLGMEAQLWRERCLFRLFRRSRIACCFCGGVCEAAGSIAFGFCGFVLCLEGFFHFSKVALLLRGPFAF